MKFSQALLCAYGITTTTQAAVLPDTTSLSIRDTLNDLTAPLSHALEKRKGGGGGGGGRGGGSSSSGSSSSGSSGSRGSGSSSSGSSSSGSSSSGSSSGSSGAASGGRSSGSSNLGGATSAGSGAPRSFGGGRYYGGGAATPYSAGARSPLGVSPFLIAAPALAFGGLWAYGAYAYPYNHPYSFHNSSRTNNGTNETLPVQCWCQQYQVCGCDDNDDPSYLNNLVGNGTNLNDTLIKRVNLNGTDTLVVNGSLPNGTTASGGTDDSTSAGVRLDGWASMSGWWMMLATVGSIVYYV